MKKLRVDELLVESGLAESRNMAQKLVLAGQVFTENGLLLDKPSRTIAPQTHLHIRNFPRYVGRGGEKLEGFFLVHREDLHNLHALDVGASTGGFTHFLLQQGVASVVCVDVGHGQLHYKLRTDCRVTNLEGINARELSKIPLPRRQFDIIVMDLSFISLKKVLTEAWKLLNFNGLAISLIKPQFEAKREEVNRGRGVIVDGAIHRRVCEEIRQYAIEQLHNCQVIAEIPSPIAGADGNREFFIGLRKVQSDSLASS
ncbi:MAG: TlyA family RNA methyltransferase [Puniceicoccales bacterium]|jgi:23S rRNA (cytidine1920-2'-O)/16S rRNA (cytidine1409-2'-O)-methyltransferase|nr:TlyA family RNA methyltransferase [Puniceicoccales bacterium]